MKKRDYNQFTKSDLPLDTSFQSPASLSNAPLLKIKPKITAIGKSTNDKVKRYQQEKVFKSKIKDKSITQKPLEKMNENELEKLNDDNMKSYSYRAKRNKTIIIILIILLSLSLVAFGVFFALSDLGANCYIYTHGNVSCTTYIDEQELTVFRTPTNIQGNRIFEFDADLIINSKGTFKVAYFVKVYQNGKSLSNTQIIKENANFSYNSETQMYESQNTIQGGERIDLLEGITLDWEYEKSLNANNFKMELHIYIVSA